MPADGYRDNELTGSVGEFLVAAELARRGWVPSITPRGVERTDVLAQHAETGAVIAVQVKTANREHFRLKQKNEETSKQWNQWYVFVSLRGLSERARFFVVPTNVVAAFVYVDHRGWLRRPGRGGATHRDSPVRAAKVADLRRTRTRGKCWARRRTRRRCTCLTGATTTRLAPTASGGHRTTPATRGQHEVPAGRYLCR